MGVVNILAVLMAFICGCNVATRSQATITLFKVGQNREEKDTPKPSQNHAPHQTNKISTNSLWARNESKENKPLVPIEMIEKESILWESSAGREGLEVKLTKRQSEDMKVLGTMKRLWNCRLQKTKDYLELGYQMEESGMRKQ